MIFVIENGSLSFLFDGLIVKEFRRQTSAIDEVVSANELYDDDQLFYILVT